MPPGAGGPGGPTPGTPGPTTPATTSVLFRFVRAQSLEVPATTTRLQFRFFSEAGGQGRLLLDQTRNFASQVRIDSVPIEARSVRITALDGVGNPVLTAVTALTLTQGQEATADFEFVEVVTPTRLLAPVALTLTEDSRQRIVLSLELSDGSIVGVAEAVWSASNGHVVVDDRGMVSALKPGSSVVTARLGNLTVDVPVEVTTKPVVSPAVQELLVDPVVSQLPVGGSSQLVFFGLYNDGARQQLDTLTLELTSANPSVAQIEADGRLTGVGPGSTTIQAKRGELTTTMQVLVTPLDELPNESPYFFFEFDPQRRLDPIKTIGESFTLPLDVLVDDQTTLEGGTLRIRGFRSYFGTETVGSLVAPTTPDIGTVTGGSTGEMTVQLDDGASPAAILAFLENVQISYQGTQNRYAVRVDLTDGRGGSFENAYFVVMRGQAEAFTVDRALPVSATNFHTFHEAMDAVAERGGPGSIVSVASGDYRRDPAGELTSLTLYEEVYDDITVRGANQSRRAGVNAETRLLATLLPPVNLDGRIFLTFDGVDFFLPNLLETQAGLDGSLFAVFQGKAVFLNCTFRSEQRSAGGIEYYGFDGLDVRDCRFENIFSGTSSYSTVGDVTFDGCDFIDAGIGLYLSSGSYDEERWVIQNNRFRDDTDLALRIRAEVTMDWLITNNSFQNDLVILLEEPLVGTVDARGNWWGRPGGPVNSQLEISAPFARVLVDPFLTSDPFAVVP